ncbi:hypothetical protein [Pseudomonas sp. JV241A]|uniref:hypothetical protein n=1 Tax=Pseudomonas sp. JV241A TaxID=2078785 RepID=UPI000FAA54F5|nr:hypothetical protein [Pseudomonas sp. JV241A]
MLVWIKDLLFQGGECRLLSWLAQSHETQVEKKQFRHLYEQAQRVGTRLARLLPELIESCIRQGGQRLELVLDLKGGTAEFQQNCLQAVVVEAKSWCIEKTGQIHVLISLFGDSHIATN